MLKEEWSTTIQCVCIVWPGSADSRNNKPNFNICFSFASGFLYFLDSTNDGLVYLLQQSVNPGLLKPSSWLPKWRQLV